MNQPTDQPTPGELAYNAYCQHVNFRSVSGDNLPAFRGQSPRLKAAWEAAAEAVLEPAEAGMRLAMLDLAANLEEGAREIRKGIKESREI
jgi:hypothetical protein